MDRIVTPEEMEAVLKQATPVAANAPAQSHATALIIEQALANYKATRLDGYANGIVEFNGLVSEADLEAAASLLTAAGWAAEYGDAPEGGFGLVLWKREHYIKRQAKRIADHWISLMFIGGGGFIFGVLSLLTAISEDLGAWGLAIAAAVVIGSIFVLWRGNILRCSAPSQKRELEERLRNQNWTPVHTSIDTDPYSV